MTEPKAHPKNFSGPMIPPLLRDDKTNTRRIIAKANSTTTGKWDGLWFDGARIDPGPAITGYPGPFLKVPHPEDDTAHRVFPRIQPGDLIWVKERHLRWRHKPSIGGGLSEEEDNIIYADDPEWEHLLAERAHFKRYNADRANPAGNWEMIPSLYMPRWASRITLLVESVRPERVQEISWADAIAEGVEYTGEREPGFGCWRGHSGLPWRNTPQEAFQDLWESLHGPGAWERNDWVWAYQFSRVKP